MRVQAVLEQPHPRDLGQIEIEQDDVELIALEEVARFFAPAARRDLVVLVLQDAGAAFAQRPVVVDDEDPNAGSQLRSELGQTDDLVAAWGSARVAPRRAT